MRDAWEQAALAQMRLLSWHACGCRRSGGTSRGKLAGNCWAGALRTLESCRAGLCYASVASRAEEVGVW